MGTILQKVKSLFGIVEEKPRRPVQKPRPKDVKRSVPSGCHFCRRTTADFTSFYDDQTQAIKVCPLCLEYAERRAYRKR